MLPPNQLPADLIRRLPRSWGEGALVDAATGLTFIPSIVNVDSEGTQQLLGWNATDGKKFYPGQVGYNYDLSGKFVSAWDASDPSSVKALLTAAIVVGGFIGAAMLAPAITGAAGTASAAPVTTSSAWLGEGALSGVPAWDGALASSQVASVAGATATTANLTGAATEPVSSLVTGSGTTAAATAGGASNLLSGAGSIATKVLGAAGTVLGISSAVAGTRNPATTALQPGVTTQPAPGGLTWPNGTPMNPLVLLAGGLAAAAAVIYMKKG